MDMMMTYQYGAHAIDWVAMGLAWVCVVLMWRLGR